MTPDAFVAKWRAAELKERSAAQEHFIDLCRLLDEPTPAEADPAGDWYCFERGARKDTGGDGWADVWKRHHFAWEYKGKHADLDAAFNQLRQYALALENPPLLIVSDMARFRVRTNWTNSVSETHEFTLDDLFDAATRDKLKGTSKNASWMVKDDRIGHSHRFGGKINSAFRGISPLGNGDSAVKEDIWYAPSHTAYAQPTIPRRCNPTKRRML